MLGNGALHALDFELARPESQEPAGTIPISLARAVASRVDQVSDSGASAGAFPPRTVHIDHPGEPPVLDVQSTPFEGVDQDSVSLHGALQGPDPEAREYL